MPIVYESVPNEPNVHISRVVPPLDVSKDAQSGLAQLNHLLETLEGTIYIISDVSAVDFSFSDVVIGMAEAASDPNSPVRNKRVVTVNVATGALHKAMTEWFKQKQYGEIDIALFGTTDEALAHIRSIRAES